MDIQEYEAYNEKKPHGDEDFPFNTYLCSIPLDFSHVPMHWHESCEVIYIKKGAGRLSIDLQWYEAEAPAVAWIRPGALHAIGQMPGRAMEYENIMFHPRLLMPEGTDRATAALLSPLLAGSRAASPVWRQEDPGFAQLTGVLDRCDALSRERPYGFPLGIKGLLCQLAFCLLSQGDRAGQFPVPARSLDKIKVILKYIEVHYAEPISIQQIAREAGLSQSHFMRLFRESMGTTFVRYLRDYRLTMAARLLAATDASVLSVAGESGFENLSYFNREFQKKYRMTPRQFRAARQGRPAGSAPVSCEK